SGNIVVFGDLKDSQFLALGVEQVHFHGQVVVSAKERYSSRNGGVAGRLKFAFNFIDFDAIQVLLTQKLVIVFVPLAQKLLRGQASEERLVRPSFAKLVDRRSISDVDRGLSFSFDAQSGEVAFI